MMASSQDFSPTIEAVFEAALRKVEREKSGNQLKNDLKKFYDGCFIECDEDREHIDDVALKCLNPNIVKNYEIMELHRQTGKVLVTA
ncbi:hypothetical protein THAR02_10412 [Trichoderma harzianum]|uniref:Uncharacterized protein n=1 Tax=Trichoderma harzianum TaxID=5544 RepID=A0A0F9ZWE5_TRIHA|nr:hypothetical protein THAR02_10412 [Trichoderma harzianum]